MSSISSINQVRQLFVALTEKAYNASLANLGDTKITGKVDTDHITGPFRFMQIGQGGLVSSDTIDPKNLVRATLTKAAKLKEKLGVHTVTVTQVSAGQIYEIKLQVGQYIGEGVQDMTYRLGTYKAKGTDTAALIAAGLAASLQSALGYDSSLGAANNIDAYRERIATVTVEGAVVTINEVEQPWSADRMPLSHMPIKVFLGPIFTETDYATVDWGTIADSFTQGTLLSVSKKVAELEYFCHGARGDVYRNTGYPRSIETKYMVNPAEANGYDLLDLHYFYVGANEAVQKSEKDITIVLPAGASHQLVTDLTPLLSEAGIALETVDVE